MDLNDMAFDEDITAVADELIESRNENRVNGFARGDRVQVINDGKYKGMVGKVNTSSPGCREDCYKYCAIVYVDLPGKNDLPPERQSPVGFIGSQLTHVD